VKGSLGEFGSDIVEKYEKLFSLFVNSLSFHHKRHNQNKAGKMKFPNKLECEADSRCALSSTNLRIKLLVSIKQLHPSQNNGK